MIPLQVGGLIDAIKVLFPHLWWIAICVAVFSYLLARYYQAKVFPRVEYHRTGPNSETYPCVEVGNRVMFDTGGGMSLFGGKKKKQTINATLNAQPEIKVFGFRTIRLHHVIEGYGKTVDIRNLVRDNPFSGGAVATSEAVMATAFENMGKSIPKGKADLMISLIIGLAGFGWGMLLGMLL